jgi:hypothetical protein
MKPNDEGDDGILISRRTALVTSAARLQLTPQPKQFPNLSPRRKEPSP